MTRHRNRPPSRLQQWWDTNTAGCDALELFAGIVFCALFVEVVYVACGVTAYLSK